jgi:glyoxylase-like metal-dependent hydrolase (beta-lactamase superfamily II)
MTRWHIGDVAITAIADLDPFELPLTRLFPKADPAVLEPHRDLLIPDHLDAAMTTAHLAVQAFLLQVDGLSILVDTCVGEHKPRPNRPDWNQREATGFLGRLAQAGVAAEAIDFVFCTHLHADHVGWNTLWRDGRWVPSFPKARYLMGRTEYAHWEAHRNANHNAFNDSVLPVMESGQVDLVDDGYSLAPGLTLLPLPGHSPGQMGLQIDRHGGRALFCGDAFHSPVQIFRPDWASTFCSDPAGAIALRERLLGELAEDQRLLVPAHFRGSGRALIRRNADGSYMPLFGNKA